MNAIVERLSPAYWWSDPAVPWDGTGALIFALGLTVVFVGAATALALRGRLPAVGRHSARVATSVASWSLGFAATGLLLVLFRWQMTPFFGRRLWFFLWLAASVAAIATVVGMALRAPSRVRS